MSLVNQVNTKTFYSSISISKKILIAIAFVIGMTINIVSIFVGNPYIVSATVVLFSLTITLLSKQYQRAWIFFATILAANPVNLNATISSNLIFAICLLIYNIQYIRELPRFIYLANIFAIISLIVSSINWLFASANLSPWSQVSAFVNYFFGPILLLPLIYFKMEKSENGHVNLIGLLFFLIIPSTIILFLAHRFGKPVASVSGDIHTLVNLTLYQFGNTFFTFTRTQVGFILSSLICASISVIICKVGSLNRLLASICLILNSFLLLVTGSVGSVLACLCGLATIFFVGMFNISITKYLIIVSIIFSLFFSVWNLSDTGVKKYMVERYEERFTKRGMDLHDRSVIWNLALDYIKNHPEGVGWSLYIREIRTYPHNDYFSYAIAYGVMGGLVYFCVLLKLGCSFFRRQRGIVEDPFRLAIRSAGLGVFVVVLINSFSDHLTANRWYFNVIWSLLWYAYFCNKNASDNSKNQPSIS